MEREVSFGSAVLGLILLTLGAMQADAVVCVGLRGDGVNRAS